MAIINTQRPGVYTDYTVSSVMGRGSSTKYAAVAAKATSGERAKVYTIDSWSQAVNTFLNDTEQTNMYGILKILFASGVGRVYCVGIDTASQTLRQDYTNAFALLEQLENIGAVICDSEDIQVITALGGSALKSAKALRERIAFCGIADTQAAVTAANALNSERVVICSPAAAAKNGKYGACFTAAAFAGKVLALNDAGYNLNGVVAEQLESIQPALTNEQVETLLLNGVSAFEKTGGETQCIKAVTTKTKTDGVTDSTFLSLNTVLTVDEVIVSLRQSLKRRLQGAKNNAQTMQSIATQLVAELSAFKDSGLIAAYELPKVYRDTADPAVCVAELSFEVSHVVNQIHIIAHIQV